MGRREAHVQEAVGGLVDDLRGRFWAARGDEEPGGEPRAERTAKAAGTAHLGAGDVVKLTVEDGVDLLPHYCCVQAAQYFSRRADPALHEDLGDLLKIWETLFFHSHSPSSPEGHGAGLHPHRHALQR